MNSTPHLEPTGDEAFELSADGQPERRDVAERAKAREEEVAPPRTEMNCGSPGRGGQTGLLGA